MENRIADIRPRLTGERDRQDELDRKIKFLQQTQKDLFRNFPFWTFPIGFFLSGNLYAIWAISKQMAAYQITIPYLGTNLFHFDTNIAIAASKF